MLTNEQKKSIVEIITNQVRLRHEDEEIKTIIWQCIMQDTSKGKLYKYRSVNEHALENLRDGTLHCAKPSSFNDPFDCKMGIDVQSFVSAYYNKMQTKIKYCVEDFFIDSTIMIERKVQFNPEREARILAYLYALTDSAPLQIETGDEKEIRKIISTGLQKGITLLQKITISLDTKEIIKESEKILDEVFDAIPLEELQQILKEADLLNFAKRKGVSEDVDEITALKLLYQIFCPKDGKLADTWEKQLLALEQQISSEIDELYRVGSLCTDFKNNLMWAHYAEGHKGFCIEYDFSKLDYVNEERLLLPVIYSEQRVKFPWNEGVFDGKIDYLLKRRIERMAIQSLLTKDEKWSYENEWRIINFNESGDANIQMPPVSCIYIGALCSEENKKVLKEIAATLNVPIRQMIVDRGEYTLRVKEVEDV